MAIRHPRLSHHWIANITWRTIIIITTRKNKHNWSAGELCLVRRNPLFERRSFWTPASSSRCARCVRNEDVQYCRTCSILYDGLVGSFPWIAFHRLLMQPCCWTTEIRNTPRQRMPNPSRLCIMHVDAAPKDMNYRTAIHKLSSNCWSNSHRC